MKRIAIIGSKGFIGKHIAWYLNKQGHNKIDCYDYLSGEEINYKQIDITNDKDVEKINFNVDYIYFFAGLTGTHDGFNNYKNYININEIGLINILNAIRKSGFSPKIIYPSTRLIYKGAEAAIKEDAEKECKTIYAINKLAAEHLLYAYSKSFNIKYTIFRICVPFGNLLSSDYSFGTIGFFIKAASLNGAIPLYGGGYMKRTFTHMEDLCEQMVAASILDESNNEVYNIGGITYSLRDAANIIATKYNASITNLEWPDKDLLIESGSTIFNSSKIEKLIGWKQYKSIEDIKENL